MKKNRIVLVNILLIAGIIAFVVFYTQSERKKLLDRQTETFENMTVAMEQVTANYLEAEQGICDAWARYINFNGDMTLEDTIAFVGASQKPGIMVHVLYEDDLSGMSTVGKSTDISDHLISYAGFGTSLFSAEPGAPGDGINMTRAYTNPVNGSQSLAFYNRVFLKDSDTGTMRPALLLRILPLSGFETKWSFPTDEYKDAEISLVDSDGNYIVRGSSFKSNNFFEFYKSYNGANYDSVAGLETAVRSQTGTFQMKNSRGEDVLIAHTPIKALKGWAVISYLPMVEIREEASTDWLLLGVVSAALAVLLMFDLTVVGSYNRQLAAAAKAAETANRAKTDFLSTMSHDIRTPMNAIIGLTTIAEKNVSDPEMVGENLRKIGLASNHLLTLINDILDISKVESGKLTLSPVSFSIAETAENLVNISQPMVKEKEIDFSFRISPFPYEYLYADQLRLNQIYINILSNAVKYTPHKGRVTVDMREEPSEKPGCVKLTYIVADNGIGMTPEFMAKMYQPFSRQIDSRVNTIQGTGLGLAITKQMVDIMGGTIDCQSKEGEGTCFTITLDIPVADRQLDEMKLEPIDVLVVDDDEILLETAQDTLRSLGASAETSSSGAEALRMIRQRAELGKEYDFVIIDWKMPDMDGLELARRIRASVGEKLPILLISAYDWSDIEDDAKQVGISGFVSKPLFRSTLYEKITELLGLESEPAEMDEDNSDIAGMNILVAEDNDINWEIIFMLLSMYGITTERAVNGQVAVEMAAAKAESYDLVFMDIQMPVMNGLEATRHIRELEDPKAASLPIIAMTADAFSENVAECMEAGMNGHIAKPIDIKLVLKEIRRIRNGQI